MKIKDIFFSSIRIIIGVFFIATAILKILTIKEFDLYIYSYGIFDYTFSTLIARCLIAFELCAGLCLTLRWLYRLVWWLLQFSLVGFSIFLIFAYLRGDANCHCLGDIVELDPLESMVKNVAVMLLMLLIRLQESWRFKKEKLVKPLVIIAIVAVPFIVTPPEVLYAKFYSTDRNVNTNIFANSLTDSSFVHCYPRLRPNAELDTAQFKPSVKDFALEGKNILVFAHAGCKYCKQGMARLALFFKENELDRKKCKILIFGGNEAVFNFIIETEAYGFEFREISPYKSIDIVNGEFPKIGRAHV